MILVAAALALPVALVGQMNERLGALSYHELPGNGKAIDAVLGREPCWKALGAPSANEARRSASSFPIVFRELSGYRKGKWTVLAFTDGRILTWDQVTGNPFYQWMPHDVEVAWGQDFGIQRRLTGELFATIIFLHELGHRLKGLPGDQGNPRMSLQNTRKVIGACVPEILVPFTTVPTKLSAGSKR